MDEKDKKQYDVLNKKYKSLYKKFANISFFKKAFDNTSIDEIMPTGDIEKDKSKKK